MPALRIFTHDGHRLPLTPIQEAQKNVRVNMAIITFVALFGIHVLAVVIICNWTVKRRRAAEEMKKDAEGRRRMHILHALKKVV